MCLFVPIISELGARSGQVPIPNDDYNQPGGEQSD